MKAMEILMKEAKNGERVIGPKNPRLQYEGRIDFGKEAGPLWTYPATSVAVRFRGSRLEVLVTNYHAYWDNFLGYVLDGQEHCVKLEESGVTRICLYDGEAGDCGAKTENDTLGNGVAKAGNDALENSGAETGNDALGNCGAKAGNDAVGSEGAKAGRDVPERCGKGESAGSDIFCGDVKREDNQEEDVIHELLLFKRQDSCHMVQIHGFLGSGDLELFPCAPLPFRRIEVYGDSVSAGEVSEAVEYCGQPDPAHNGEYSNSFYSYAWLTARKLGARIHDVAQGGIALMDGIGYFWEPEQKGMESIFDKVQYQPQLLAQFPEELGGGGGICACGERTSAAEPAGCKRVLSGSCSEEALSTEPDDRNGTPSCGGDERALIIEPADCKETPADGAAEKSPAGGAGKPLAWDFSLYRPQVVILAVGQNDSHPVDFCGEDYEGEQAAVWRERYGALVRRLRAIHPRAHIICMTTILNHHENWDRSIEEICAGMGDEKVHHFLFSNNGRGTQGHIRRPEAERMAEELSAYIEALGEDIWRDTERLERVFDRAEKGEALTIGFLGGSITQGSLASRQENCYASLVYRWWQERFPEAEFTCVNAGIGGTTSHFGAARVEEDLLYAKPDVVFVEFSVNDEDEAHFRECYEGLIRRLLKCEWKPAVVLLHNRFYSDGHSAQRIHDEVGRYYGLPRVCMGDAIYPRIASGELPAKAVTPDGLHPNDKGHALLAEIIRAKLEGMYGEYKKRNFAGASGKGGVVEAAGKNAIEGVLESAGERAGEITGEIATEIPEEKRQKNVESQKLPAPLTRNRYETTRRFRNDTIRPVKCIGFTADQTPQTVITETFRKGWTARKEGDEICFEVEGRCIALQYRRTLRKPAPKALACVDGDWEHGIILDGNFDEDWGDCLELQVLLEEDVPGRHRVTVRIMEAEAVETPFYLVSVLLA